MINPFSAGKSLLKKTIFIPDAEEACHVGNLFTLFERNLRDFKPANFLDAGCGASNPKANSGRNTLKMADFFHLPKTAIEGIDISEFHVTMCQQFFRAQVVNMDLENLPFEDSTFDLVVCNQVLEHLKHWRHGLYELERITSQGGYLIIGIPNLAHLINRIYLMLGWQPLSVDLYGDHSSGFAHGDLLQFFDKNLHMQVVDFAGSLMYPLPHFMGNPLANLLPSFAGYTTYLLKKH